MCNLFLADGPIVSVAGKNGRVLEEHLVRRPGTQVGTPLAILIDRSSASAAEIVAGALHDRHRARLFGTRTYGKGSVQSMIDLSDGSGLKLTVARYRTPSGATLEGRGVEPDQVIAEPPTEGRDPVLDAARAWLER